MVFVSAYREFAVEGFDLEVADYLLKPVSPLRLAKCIDKLVALNNASSISHSDVLFLKSSGKLFRVSVEDIYYVQSMENYVQVFLRDKRLICKVTLSYLVEKLRAYGFVQVHRSYLVNTCKIESMAKLEISINDVQIPISRDKKKEIYTQIIGTKPSLEAS